MKEYRRELHDLLRMTGQSMDELFEKANKITKESKQTEKEEEQINKGQQTPFNIQDMMEQITTLVNGVNMMQLVEEVYKKSDKVKKDILQADSEKGQTPFDMKNMMEEMNTLVNEVNMMQMLMNGFMNNESDNKTKKK